MSILEIGPARLPFSGGGYMRLLPRWLIRRGFDTFERAGIPAVVYLHPRDFAPECPRIPMPLKRRFKGYVGLRSTKAKLRMLLDNYEFDSCSAVLGLEPLRQAHNTTQKPSVTARVQEEVFSETEGPRAVGKRAGV